MKRKFYKTTVTVEVLSEGVLDFDNLADLHEIVADGDCVGRHWIEKSQTLTSKRMAKATYVFGSSPGFFQLDNKGKTTNA